MGLSIERSALTSCSFPVKNSYHNKKFVAGTLLVSPQHNNGYYYCAWCGADCVLHSAHRLSWYMLMLDYRTNAAGHGSEVRLYIYHLQQMLPLGVTLTPTSGTDPARETAPCNQEKYYRDDSFLSSRPALGPTAPAASADARYFVLWSTTSPTRLYHLTGGPTLLAMFSAYLQSGTTSYTELPTLAADPVAGIVPPSLKRAHLVCYSNRGLQASHAARTTSTAQQFALMTELGIYHGTLLFSTNASGGAE
jgi:hypothetical protein